VKSILVITSKLPYPATGADEQDRFEGLKLLKEAGYEVSVVAKIAKYQKAEDAKKMSEILGMPVDTVPYGFRGFTLRRFLDWKFLDGAAYEYADPMLKQAIEKEIARFKPDSLWLDGSFIWPLIPLARRHKLPVFVRSLQIESTHVFADEGFSIPNIVRAFVKDLGERYMAKHADVVVAINRNEEELYRQMGAKKAITIPLRQLPSILEKGGIEYRDVKPLHVLFTASTFSVTHNRVGAEKVFKEIAPLLETKAPGEFVIHVTGAKLPEADVAMLPKNVKYEGYIPDFDSFMKTMDIAITQSLGVVGMHGKLFAPIAQGIPTVTQSFALAGFPFKDGEHLLFAESPEEVVEKLLSLRDVKVREKIGEGGLKLSQQLFSRAAILNVLKGLL
jgi:hypothetical protein